MTFPVLTGSLDLLHRVAASVPADQLGAPTPCSQWTVAQVLLHAAGDQHAWASIVGSGSPPGYDPFAPPRRPGGDISQLITDAINAATTAWAGVDPAARTVPPRCRPPTPWRQSSPLPPVRSMRPSTPGTSLLPPGDPRP